MHKSNLDLLTGEFCSVSTSYDNDPILLNGYLVSHAGQESHQCQTDDDPFNHRTKIATRATIEFFMELEGKAYTSGTKSH